MKTKLLAAAAAALALAFSAGAHAAGPNLVANGSFELGTAGIGSFGGWQAILGDATTFVDSSGHTSPHPGDASDGLWSAFFGSTQADGGSTISQQLATSIGQTYLLSFDLANDNGGLDAANGLVARVGGSAVAMFSALGVQDYAHQQLSFTATSTSTLLSFAAYNDNGYLQLDRVAVVAVPEPASWALALAGLVAVGLRSRRGQRA